MTFLVCFRARIKDSLLTVYPTVVEFKSNHNRGLVTADTLKHRDVDKETVEKFKKFSPVDTHQPLPLTLTRLICRWNLEKTMLQWQQIGANVQMCSFAICVQTLIILVIMFSD